MLLRNVGKFLPDHTAIIPEDCIILISNILYSRRLFFLSNDKKETFLTFNGIRNVSRSEMSAVCSHSELVLCEFSQL